MDKVHEKVRVHCTLSMHIKLQGTYKLGYRIIKEGHQAPQRFPTFNFSLMFIGSTPLSKSPKYGIKIASGPLGRECGQFVNHSERSQTPILL